MTPYSDGTLQSIAQMIMFAVAGILLIIAVDTFWPDKKKRPPR